MFAAHSNGSPFLDASRNRCSDGPLLHNRSDRSTGEQIRCLCRKRTCAELLRWRQYTAGV
uniref:Uncharacterized protein n=1 Tax=Anopheles minimus TaxID=112268 RepID=A0A182WP52_9DIPT